MLKPGGGVGRAAALPVPTTKPPPPVSVHELLWMLKQALLLRLAQILVALLGPRLTPPWFATVVPPLPPPTTTVTPKPAWPWRPEVHMS